MGLTAGGEGWGGFVSVGVAVAAAAASMPHGIARTRAAKKLNIRMVLHLVVASSGSTGRMAWRV